MAKRRMKVAGRKVGITAAQKSARRKNIAVARSAKKKRKHAKPLHPRPTRKQLRAAGRATSVKEQIKRGKSKKAVAANKREASSRAKRKAKISGILERRDKAFNRALAKGLKKKPHMTQAYLQMAKMKVPRKTILKAIYKGN